MPGVLDEVSAAILEHCLAGNRLAALLARYPGSTVYRRVKKFVKQGLIAKEGDVYRTTDGGREALGSPAFRSDLEKRIPRLRLVPTPVHRAMLELVLGAVVIRRHGMKDDHHASFVLLGPTMSWKTWMGKMACVIFGLDPVDHVVLSNAESGRSLFTRRGFAGRTVSKRSVLFAPLVVIDEYQKADEDTRRMADVYLQGSRIVSYENERLPIKPVPLFAMNPLGGETLEQRTGLDAARLRRCVVADFSKVVIPSELRSRGEEFLAEAKKASPIALASLKPGDCSAFRGAVSEALDQCLVPEARTRVDEELVVQLAEGMAAFVPPVEAWIIVIRDLLLIWETLGWTSPGWRLRLPTATPKEQGATHGPVPARRGPPSLREETLSFLAEAGHVPRDLALAELIETEKATLKATRAELAKAYRRKQTTPKEVEGFVKVRQQLKDAGVAWDAPTLLWAARFMAGNGQHANAVAHLAYELFVRGIRGGDADLFLKNLPPGKTWEQAIAWLGELTRQYGSLDAAVTAKAAEGKAASGRVAASKAHEEQILAESANAQAELDRVRTELATTQEKLAETRAETARVTTDLGRSKTEHARIHSDLDGRKRELRSTEERLAARRHLAALYRALERALLGEEAEAWTIIRSLGASTDGNPVRMLRELTSRAIEGRRVAKLHGARQLARRRLAPRGGSESGRANQGRRRGA